MRFFHSSFRWCSTEFFQVNESTMILQISTTDENDDFPPGSGGGLKATGFWGWWNTVEHCLHDNHRCRELLRRLALLN
ncbi:MAG: hypothetical protein DMG05_12225 [Acidobacteria bacterium]|nr:MAG: hypothetical protein DMG05_12225 [Acidobacteriota bacterium]